MVLERIGVSFPGRLAGQFELTRVSIRNYYYFCSIQYDVTTHTDALSKYTTMAMVTLRLCSCRAGPGKTESTFALDFA